MRCRYGTLLEAMYDELKGKRQFGTQEPQLSASTKFDLDKGLIKFKL